MSQIVTLTLNPALDKNSQADKVLPEKKIRCDEPIYEPGGGGINVSRAIKKLGGESLAIYMAGGPTGELMHQELDREKIGQEVVNIKEWTRENLMILEKSTGRQYRFGMPGARVSDQEWKKCQEIIDNLSPTPDFLVASGSLPPGLPEDAYAKIAKLCRKRDIKFILDTSGEGLIKGANEGVYLLKPNLNELAQLVGKEKITAFEQEDFAQKIINEGKSDIVVVSLGPRGAMLATKETIQYITPPTVPPKSAVGAGDSMVAGMVLKLSEGWSLSDVVKYGVSSGTAATMTPGTELCRKEDTEKIFEWLRNK